MLADIPVRLDQPLWLVLLLLLIPAFLLSRRSIGGLSRRKAYGAFALRALVISALAVALAEPSWEKRGKGLTVTLVLDRSQSIAPDLQARTVEFLARAVELKERPEDRVAVITVAKQPTITAMADAYSGVTVGSDDGDPSATNLASAVRLALAIMPDDTANRIVLASDGNETMDSVLAAAELARANNVPIDVLPIEYEHANEVIFEQLVAPTRARRGQAAKLRMILRSQAEATGTIRLRMNGEPLDLNGDEPGDGMRVELQTGTTALEQTIELGDAGPHQFEATFVPDEGIPDVIDRNNRAVAVTFVGGQGKVLVIDDGAAQSQHLMRALTESGIDADLRAPDVMLGGLVTLSGYDTIVMVNIPRWAIDPEQDRMLHAYIHDLGGGLVMIGGPQSFGAGGWIDSELARALPVKLNPPDTRQMPAGALALIMHSCEMPQGNYWGQKVAEAAINALSRLDFVGIVEFNWAGVGGIQGCSWAFDMQRVGDKTAALQATKQMQVGDMPSFAPSMQLALQGLQATTAAQRHAIIISDGDPSPPGNALLQAYMDARVTVTTVMVGGHGTMADRNSMRNVATKTGGQFYDVKNPKQLPQIFIKEARIVSRSLIQDGNTYEPRMATRLPGPLSGFDRFALPVIDGYVLTAPREGMAQTAAVIPTMEGNDPLFAHWNYGLGRSIAYTSDLSSLWGSAWVGWGQFQAFWEQAVRWSMRPSTPANVHVNTRFEGDLAVVEVEALDADASFLNFLRTQAILLRPDQRAEPLPLQQTGPGRYRGEFPTTDAGAYLVNIAYESGTAERAQQGSVQAAVTVPYAREFRAVKHNRALLKQVAASTGGRVLATGDPILADLFDRGSLEVPRSLKRVWDLLAIIAASLLVIDVAARRLSIDTKAARAAAARALGSRSEVSTGTVAAWKRTRAGVAHRQTPAGETKAALRGQRARRFEADESTASTAIDVGAEQTGGPSTPAAPIRTAPEPDRGPETDDDGDYTARLLAAKRRARGDGDGDGGAGSGGGRADG